MGCIESKPTPAGSGRDGDAQLNPLSAKPQKFNDKYSVGNKLGAGAFAEVKVGLVGCKSNSISCKILRKLYSISCYHLATHLVIRICITTKTAFIFYLFSSSFICFFVSYHFHFPLFYDRILHCFYVINYRSAQRKTKKIKKTQFMLRKL